MPKKNFQNSQPVYSTGVGRICPECKQPIANCTCQQSKETPPTDGIVRIRREVKGRRGKTVTTISGVPLPTDQLEALARALKRSCGSGGSVKDGVIIIQGDQRQVVASILKEYGFKVKFVGG